MNTNRKLLIGCALLWVGLISFGFAAVTLRPSESGIGYTLLSLAGTSGIIMIAVVSIATTICEAAVRQKP